MSLRLLFSVQASDEIDAAVTWLGENYGDASNAVRILSVRHHSRGPVGPPDLPI